MSRERPLWLGPLLVVGVLLTLFGFGVHPNFEASLGIALICGIIAGTLVNLRG